MRHVMVSVCPHRGASYMLNSGLALNIAFGKFIQRKADELSAPAARGSGRLPDA